MSCLCQFQNLILDLMACFDSHLYTLFFRVLLFCEIQCLSCFLYIFFPIDFFKIMICFPLICNVFISFYIVQGIFYHFHIYLIYFFYNLLRQVIIACSIFFFLFLVWFFHLWFEISDSCTFRIECCVRVCVRVRVCACVCMYIALIFPPVMLSQFAQQNILFSCGVLFCHYIYKKNKLILYWCAWCRYFLFFFIQYIRKTRNITWLLSDIYFLYIHTTNLASYSFYWALNKCMTVVIIISIAVISWQLNQCGWVYFSL